MFESGSHYIDIEVVFLSLLYLYMYMIELYIYIINECIYILIYITVYTHINTDLQTRFSNLEFSKQCIYIYICLFRFVAFKFINEHLSIEP